MDRFQEMQVFVAVADEQSFASAARRLNMSAPSVTRAVAALEERIGTRLLARTTRSLHITEAGQRYLADCRRILAELEEAEESAAGSHAVARGQLNVTAPVLFGELFVTPLLVDYLDQYPQVQAKALLVDRVVNMAEEDIDVAIRIGDLPENNLHRVKVGTVRRVICASPAFWPNTAARNIPMICVTPQWFWPRAARWSATGNLWGLKVRSRSGRNRGWWSRPIRQRSVLHAPAGG